MSNPKPALKDLFAAYNAEREKGESAKRAMRLLEEAESAAIEPIVKHYGSGPFKVGGREIQFRKPPVGARKGLWFATEPKEATKVGE